MLIACVLGLAVGDHGGLLQRQVAGSASMTQRRIGLGIPDFLWALLFVLLLGVMFPVLPISGRLDPSVAFEPRTDFYLLEALVTGQLAVARGAVAASGVCRPFALALPLAAGITRVLKSSLLETMSQDYVTLARVKGYSRARVLMARGAAQCADPGAHVDRRAVHFPGRRHGADRIHLLLSRASAISPSAP